MQKILYIAVGALVVICAFSAYVAHSEVSAATLNNGGPEVFYAVASSTAETVGTTNTLTIATGTGRTWARIANVSANAITCIYANGKPATVTNGFIITASSTFEMNQLNEPVYTGAVNCISDTASPASIYVEVNQ